MEKQTTKMLIVLLSSLVLTVQGAILKTVDFSDFPVGAHHAHDSIGGKLWYEQNQDTQSFIAKGGANGNKFWRTLFPRHCQGHGCGAQLLTSQPSLNDREEIWFSLSFRVASNFDFVNGGILPGVCGGACDTTCSHVPGDENGWSVRLHFDGAGNMNVNIFDMTRETGGCGRFPNLSNNGARIKIQKGKWHFVEMRVKLNTANDPSNGSLHVYVDRKQGLYLPNIQWRTDLTMNHIESFYASMYLDFGPKLPEQDSNVSFDDFTFSTTRLAAPTPHPVKQPTRAPTKSPTKEPTASPTNMEQESSTPPTELQTSEPTVNVTDIPNAAKPNIILDIDTTTMAAAIGGVCLLMGIAMFATSRRYRKDREMKYNSPHNAKDAPQALRPSVARRVDKIFKSTSSRKKSFSVATPPGGMGNMKPSKGKLLGLGSLNEDDSSFSTINPMFRAGSADGAWDEVVSSAAVEYQCLCADKSAGVVPINSLQRTALRVLAKQLGIGFHPFTTTQELLYRVSSDSRLVKNDFIDSRFGPISVCRTCLKSQSPDV